MLVVCENISNAKYSSDLFDKPCHLLGPLLPLLENCYYSGLDCDCDAGPLSSSFFYPDLLDGHPHSHFQKKTAKETIKITRGKFYRMFFNYTKELK